MDGNLNLDIALVVLDEQFPFVRCIISLIPGTSAVGDSRIAWCAEVSDQILALGELLSLKTEHCTDTHQR